MSLRQSAIQSLVLTSHEDNKIEIMLREYIRTMKIEQKSTIVHLEVVLDIGN